MAHITVCEDNGIYWDISGTLEPEEIIEFNEELSDDLRLRELRYFIWDSSKVTKISIDKDDATLASIFGKLTSKYNRHVKGAFVVTDQHLKPLVQEYIDHSKELDSTWKFMMFEDIESARKWL